MIELILAALAGIVLAFFGGQLRGKRKAHEAQLVKAAKSVMKREEAAREYETADDEYLVRVLTDAERLRDDD